MAHHACLKLARNSPLGDNSASGFFGGPSDLLNLIAEEEAGHLLQRNTEATLGLEMMQGKFGKAVDLALQKNALLESPFLFALAPFGNFPHFFSLGEFCF